MPKHVAGGLKVGSLVDDGLWRIMQLCWAHRVTERPAMAEVRDELAARLGEVSALPAKYTAWAKGFIDVLEPTHKAWRTAPTNGYLTSRGSSTPPSLS